VRVRAPEVVLGTYSVVVFATPAGALGAFFLHRGDGTGRSAPVSRR
jgi:hypothetical protein